MAEFVKVGQVQEFPEGSAKSVRIHTRSVAVFNVKGTLYAVDDFCTHMGAPLSTGMVGGKTVTCEWHGATFNLETGKLECGPGRDDINAYKVRITDDDVEIEIEI